ncbi:hypothetical protein EDC01DRAFT_627124 [Geopyxis carbonaria]|nr:hypothetical protein EDC01DRAFT_627124 [Geopyxis carbonaria]
MSSGGMGSTLDGGILPAPPVKPQAINWHDLMTANLAGTTFFELGDFQDIPIAPAVSMSAIKKDGKTLQWVDLPSLVSLIEEYNFGQPIEGQKRISEATIHALKYWYGPKSETSAHAPAGEAILAVPLLRFFMEPSTLQNLLTQLPVNVNGLLEDELAFTTQAAPISALSALTIESFRAKIVAPTADQRMRGQPLYIMAFHFELAPPPVRLVSSVNPNDVLQWAIPFENGIWKRGQVRLKHDGNLRVKMLSPQYTDPVIYVYFSSKLRVNRGLLTAQKEHEFEVKGKMVAKGGPKQTAVYDLLIAGDANGTVSVLDMLKLWAPSGVKASFADSLARMFTNLEVPGLEFHPKLY